MRGTIDSGHTESDKLELLSDFREELIILREDNGNRMTVRRDGHSKSRADGSTVYGPFTMPVRRMILDRLRQLEAQTGESLISAGEIEAIEDVWWRDEIRGEGQARLLERVT